MKDLLDREMRIADLSRAHVVKHVLADKPILKNETIDALKVDRKSCIVIKAVRDQLSVWSGEGAGYHASWRPVFYFCALHTGYSDDAVLTIQNGMDLVLASHDAWKYKYELLAHRRARISVDVIPQHFESYRNNYDARKLDYDAWHSSKRPSRAAKRRLGQ